MKMHLRSKRFGGKVCASSAAGAARGAVTNDVLQVTCKKCLVRASGGLFPRRTYTETEAQGPGRRYWFRTATDCRAFTAGKLASGYAVVYDAGSRTMWASRSKKSSHAVDAIVRGGIDPWAATPWSKR